MAATSSEQETFFFHLTPTNNSRQRFQAPYCQVLFPEVSNAPWLRLATREHAVTWLTTPAAKADGQLAARACQGHATARSIVGHNSAIKPDSKTRLSPPRRSAHLLIYCGKRSEESARDPPRATLSQKQSSLPATTSATVLQAHPKHTMQLLQ